MGGPNSQAYNVNNKGDVVGFSGNADGSIIHGFRWHRGHMHDLGVLPGDVFSFGAASNDHGEIVGASGDAHGNERAVIWQHEAMIDLNTLIPSESPLFLLEGDYINSHGQIVGIAFDTASGQIRGYVATPIHNKDDGDTSMLRQGQRDIGRKEILPETVRMQIRHRLHARRIELPAPALRSW